MMFRGFIEIVNVCIVIIKIRCTIFLGIVPRNNKKESGKAKIKTTKPSSAKGKVIYLLSRIQKRVRTTSQTKTSNLHRLCTPITK